MSKDEPVGALRAVNGTLIGFRPSLSCGASDRYNVSEDQ